MSRAGRSSRANGAVAISEQPAAQQPPAPVVRRLGVRQLVVGLGDSARERTVLDAVGGSLGSDQEAEQDWSFQVVRRCVTARDLLETLESGAADVAVVGTDLHGLGLDAVWAVTHTRVPLVLVPAGPGEESWNDLHAPHLVVLSADPGPDQVRREAITNRGRWLPAGERGQ